GGPPQITYIPRYLWSSRDSPESVVYVRCNTEQEVLTLNAFAELNAFLIKKSQKAALCSLLPARALAVSAARALESIGPTQLSVPPPRPLISAGTAHNEKGRPALTSSTGLCNEGTSAGAEQLPAVTLQDALYAAS
ncbi:hypothetical protein JOQ06_018142, partial [Pogonophryne albipinna]